MKLLPIILTICTVLFSAQLAGPPQVTHYGTYSEITFTLSENSDVEVAIVDADNNIIRHLAADVYLTGSRLYGPGNINPLTTYLDTAHAIFDDPNDPSLYEDQTMLDITVNDVTDDLYAKNGWPDGSARWVLLTFPADIAAQNTTAYTLRINDTPASPVSGTHTVTVTDAGDAIVVNTGVLSFQVAKSGDITCLTMSYCKR